MKKNKTILFLLVATAALIGKNGFCQTEGDEAKEIFISEKCQRCHSISALEIVHSGPREISDLSGVGTKHTAEWLIKYLKREESLNGKKHLKNLVTSGADIDKLAKWLAGLKGK